MECFYYQDRGYRVEYPQISIDAHQNYALSSQAAKLIANVKSDEEEHVIAFGPLHLKATIRKMPVYTEAQIYDLAEAKAKELAARRWELCGRDEQGRTKFEDLMEDYAWSLADCYMLEHDQAEDEEPFRVEPGFVYEAILDALPRTIQRDITGR